MEHPLSRRALEIFDAIYPPDGSPPPAKLPKTEATAAPVQQKANQVVVPGKHTRGGIVDQVSRIPKSTDKLNAISFFSGAMGLDIGLENAGINIVLACEFDRMCRHTILANQPDIGLLGDVNAYSVDEILEHSGLERGEVDLIVGGPPCQAFSTAGRRKGFEDERGNVFLRFVDIILDIRPRYFVIENVRGLLSAPLKHRPHSERGDHQPLTEEELSGGAITYIIKMLEAGGYDVSFNLYNSANFGTPQVRERVVIIGNREGNRVPYLMPTHSHSPEYGLPPWRTVRDAIAQLSPQSDHLTFPESRLRYYRMLKEGQYWRHLPVHLHKEAMGASYFAGGGKTGFYRRLAWDKPSCTLVTHPAMPATDICHPVEDRPLSVTEYKRIQQFPDVWQLHGSIFDQYKQIGNAVPVGLGEAIGRAIIAHSRGQTMIPPSGFKFSRYRDTDDITWRRIHGGRPIEQMRLFAA
jgi:DNA (cytosine-5)-methyltransferase 1